uniref:response regulator transcription factor n=1 Tax=Chroococcidiopsis sp. TS-821 TaxID=1378066 RepID=UPI001AF029A7|nr:helix-turn-helix transcriptional regulator [Chroococcidiopsis sp. TS-821]
MLRLIARGASNCEIAQALYVSKTTVKNHVTSILNYTYAIAPKLSCSLVHFFLF